jgi:hypothetical protein
MLIYLNLFMQIRTEIINIYLPIFTFITNYIAAFYNGVKAHKKMCLRKADTQMTLNNYSIAFTCTQSFVRN